MMARSMEARAESCIVFASEKEDITPLRMIPLSGYGGRTGKADGIADHLEANSIALKDVGGRVAVIVTIDALYVGPVLDSKIRSFLGSWFGVKSTDILVLASHTHFAPALDPTKPLLGRVDPDHLNWVVERCEAMLQRLLTKPMRPLRVQEGHSPWDGAIHRRKRWVLPYFVGRLRLVWNQPANAPNPRGPTDPVVRLWRLTSDDDNIVAVIWTCSCHTSEFPKMLHVSADFCGPARARIRKVLDIEAPVLFLQGFAGDLRPRIPDNRLLAYKLVRALLFGPSFALFNKETWANWTNELCNAVSGSLHRAMKSTPRAVVGLVQSAMEETPLSEIVTGAVDVSRTVTFQRLKIGGVLDFVAISAEPSIALRRLIPFPEAVSIGYSGDVFGYWPTDVQRMEGGYEGRRFFDAFGLRGQFRPGLNRRFSDAISHLESLK
jgi:hypothetical protein